LLLRTPNLLRELLVQLQMLLWERNSKFLSSMGFWKSFADVCRGSFTPPERKCYTDAIACLQNLQSLLNSSEVPGAKFRYDGIFCWSGF
jgi:hypothetical protein